MIPRTVSAVSIVPHILLNGHSTNCQTVKKNGQMLLGVYFLLLKNSVLRKFQLGHGSS